MTKLETALETLQKTIVLLVMVCLVGCVIFINLVMWTLVVRIIGGAI